MNYSNITILDNGGKTLDRITVVYHATNERGQVGHQGMSENATGYCQWGFTPNTMTDYSHMGVEVKYSDVSEGVQKQIDSTLSDIAPSAKELIKYLREDFDSVDRWGWCMGWLFGLADYVLHTDHVIVNGFNSSISGADTDDERFKTISLYNVDGEQAQRAFNILSRYESLLRKYNHNY